MLSLDKSALNPNIKMSNSKSNLNILMVKGDMACGPNTHAILLKCNTHPNFGLRGEIKLSQRNGDVRVSEVSR